MIHGGVQVGTEIWDDSGAPHTLEHLVFMGSEKFPYKGVLDVLGNRMIGNGTNAWTSTNCTNFTSCTASEEGFLKLLPVYLDHIFFPTITKSAFCTEVYHMNGKGEDSGTVLSEMQAKQHDSSTLIQLETQKSLYNEDNANRSETGGMVDALRELKKKTVERFHNGAYVPQNVTISVVGSAISPLKLLTVLSNTIEPSLAAHALDQGEHGPPHYKRPFLETKTAKNPPTIDEDEIRIVKYPSKDESVGVVTINWIGPRATDETTKAALTLLGIYLMDSVVSPLKKLFVEIKEPLCTDISLSTGAEDPQILTIQLDSVPYAKLDDIGDLVQDALVDIAGKPFDMERMKNQINLQMLSLLEIVEGGARTYIITGVQNDALFGAEDGSELEGAFKDMSRCKTLMAWSSSDWQKLLTDYFITPNSLTIIAKPSAKLVDKVAAKEKLRIAQNVAKLGPAGLAELDAKAAAAAVENAKPIPTELIESYEVPSVATSIRWIEIETARTYPRDNGSRRGDSKLQDKIDDDRPNGFSLDLHFSQIKSEFITITIYLFPSANLSTTLRSLLPLYATTFFTLPVVRANGQKLSYQDVVKALNVDTVDHEFNSGPLLESLFVKIKVEKSKYAIGIAWLKDLIFGSIFDEKCLNIGISQELQDLPSEKMSGHTIASAGLTAMLFSENSITQAFNLLLCAKNLPKLAKSLRSNPKDIIRKLEQLRDGLTDPKAMKIKIVGDILSLDRPVSIFKSEFEPTLPFSASKRIAVVRDGDILTPVVEKPSTKLVVYKVPSIDSTYGKFMGRGPKWDSQDLPAFILACQVLNATEGHLWNAVRGKGLAYGATLGYSYETGILTYNLFKSPDVFEAWLATKDLFENDLLSGKTKITELQIEAAKSMYAFDTASKEAMKVSAASVITYNELLLDRPKDFHRELLARTENVSRSQVIAVIRNYLHPLVKPTTSIGSISAGPSKAEELVKKFSSAGFQVNLIPFE